MADLNPKGTAWTQEDVLHLARRAGFGMTPEEADAFLAGHGPFASLVDDWVDGTGIDRSAFTAALSVADPVTEDGLAGPHPYQVGGTAHAWRNDLDRAQAWLAFRMQYDPNPFPERMALFWHNLFATGQHKVDNVALMVNQWDMLRARGLDRFDDLLVEVSKDAAMGIWLDSVRNNASGTRVPNENYAREVLELYSLGVDNGYRQNDITELAVALAGWSYTVAPGDISVEPGNADNRRVARGTFAVYDGSPTPAGHLRWDLGGENAANLPNMRRNPATAPSVNFLEATFQAESPPAGMVKGEECVRAILARRASQSAGFLAARLLRHFVSTQFTQQDVNDLAAEITLQDFDIRAVMKTLLKSNHFYALANRQNLVEGPVSWAVRAARGLGYDLASANSLPGLKGFPAWTLVTPSFDPMGMNLLDPNGPNGWKEDVAWMSSNTFRYRTRLAAAVALAETRNEGGVNYTLFPSDPNAWFPGGPPTTAPQVLDRLTALLQPATIPTAVRTSWLAALWPSGMNGWNDADQRAARQLAFLILCSPAGQLY
jgi:uncharacterized protein (DUF1800 family)